MIVDFIALDVETANADPKSICQIGIAVFKNGELTESWSSLVNPNAEFDWMNVQIHGIDESKVASAPTIFELKSKLDELVGENIVCTYTNFDKVSLNKNFGQTDYSWLDITAVVRRTWEKVSRSGYGLFNVCRLNNIKIDQHHNAESDAIAAGRILVAALKAQGIDLSDCHSLIKKKIVTLIAKGKMADAIDNGLTNIIIDGGNPDGDWYGDVLCFTGEISMPRVEASILASQAGFDVGKGVTKKTNYLVKGVQDLTKLNGKNISSKEEKALSLIKGGQDIIIISEEDFFEMIGGAK